MTQEEEGSAVSTWWVTRPLASLSLCGVGIFFFPQFASKKVEKRKSDSEPDVDVVQAASNYQTLHDALPGSVVGFGPDEDEEDLNPRREDPTHEASLFPSTKRRRHSSESDDTPRDVPSTAGTDSHGPSSLNSSWGNVVDSEVNSDKQYETENKGSLFENAAAAARAAASAANAIAKFTFQRRKNHGDIVDVRLVEKDHHLQQQYTPSDDQYSCQDSGGGSTSKISQAAVHNAPWAYQPTEATRDQRYRGFPDLPAKYLMQEGAFDPSGLDGGFTFDTWRGSTIYASRAFASGFSEREIQALLAEKRRSGKILLPIFCVEEFRQGGDLGEAGAAGITTSRRSGTKDTGPVVKEGEASTMLVGKAVLEAFAREGGGVISRHEFEGLMGARFRFRDELPVEAEEREKVSTAWAFPRERDRSPVRGGRGSPTPGPPKTAPQSDSLESGGGKSHLLKPPDLMMHEEDVVVTGRGKGLAAEKNGSKAPAVEQRRGRAISQRSRQSNPAPVGVPPPTSGDDQNHDPKGKTSCPGLAPRKSSPKKTHSSYWKFGMEEVLGLLYPTRIFPELRPKPPREWGENEREQNRIALELADKLDIKVGHARALTAFRNKPPGFVTVLQLLVKYYPRLYQIAQDKLPHGFSVIIGESGAKQIGVAEDGGKLAYRGVVGAVATGRGINQRQFKEFSHSGNPVDFAQLSLEPEELVILGLVSARVQPECGLLFMHPRAEQHLHPRSLHKVHKWADSSKIHI